MPPLVPGFTLTGELSSGVTGSTWAAVRTLGDQPVVLKILRVPDVVEAQSRATAMRAVLDRIENEHLVRQHEAVVLADGTLAVVLDQVAGGSLARLLGDRGHLSPGETVTTVAPLFGALADLHAVGVVHGDLTPGSVLFSVDGKPLISDLGVALLLRRFGHRADRAECFVAPEVVSGAMPSSASDVYSMAALGWFCLLGAPPAPPSSGSSATTVSPQTPALLVGVLASCLSADPTARPSARAAAVEVFDAALAESVILTSIADPATEITRRIRATAAAVSVQAPPSIGKRLRRPLFIVAVALLVAATIGAGTIWFMGRTSEAVRPTAVRSAAPLIQSPSTDSTSTGPTVTVLAPATTPQGATDVVAARDSPRIAAAGLLQALVDARALAYAARDPVLLDLVYAPGATRAGADRSNLVTALEKGATYLALSFVVKDAAYLDGTSDTARVRATIVTPAYETGQPDGRKVAHAQETVGPSVFTLNLTRDGWRILGLTAP